MSRSTLLRRLEQIERTLLKKRSFVFFIARSQVELDTFKRESLDKLRAIDNQVTVIFVCE
jgi:hypothetical protein